MRNQLLRDSDWASMAHSVELRTPFVDSKLLADLAPLISHFHAGQGKRALAQTPSKPLPEQVANRPKTGFLVPMRQWMLGVTPEERNVNHAKGLISRDWAKYVFQEFRSVA
jgi:asparagine synthase (glutamine-hydrolysing)